MASDFFSGHLYPTLAYSVPVYNYLLDKIEVAIDSKGLFSNEVKSALGAAHEKIREYYPSTDGLVYIIATSKYIITYTLK